MEAIVFVVVLTGIGQMWFLSRVVSAIKDLQNIKKKSETPSTPAPSREPVSVSERRVPAVVLHLPLADHKAVNPHVTG